MATPLPTVPKTFKIVFHHSLGADMNMDNVLHGTYSGGPPLPLADALNIADIWRNAWVTNVLPLVTSQVTLVDVTLTDLHTATGVQVVRASGAAGSGTGSHASAGLALVIHEKSALRGRSFNGRIFLGGIETGNLASPQTWLPALVTAANSGFSAFNTAVLTGTPATVPAIVSYFGPPTVKAGQLSPGVPRRAHSTVRGTGLSTPLSSFSVSPQVGHQRRRG
jgi:hypothetical protein